VIVDCIPLCPGIPTTHTNTHTHTHTHTLSLSLPLSLSLSLSLPACLPACLTPPPPLSRSPSLSLSLSPSRSRALFGVCARLLFLSLTHAGHTYMQRMKAYMKSIEDNSRQRHTAFVNFGRKVDGSSSAGCLDVSACLSPAYACWNYHRRRCPNSIKK